MMKVNVPFHYHGEQFDFNDAHDDNDNIPPGDDEYVDNDIFEAHFDMEPPKQK